ncbi:hypothetical protein FLA_0231 [Filimonas lacunae]|nr:hypothetical protein FLA_0231 [Filimonas lacunae]
MLAKGVGLFTCLAILLTACNTLSPDQFFQKAVLNSNMVSDFGTAQFAKMLESYGKEYPAGVQAPPKKGDEAQEAVKNKALYLEKVIKELKTVSENDDNREIKKLALELYEFTLPAYQNEYAAYAKLCDTKGADDAKVAILKTIDEKYTGRFEVLFTQLMEKGKVYAAKHNLKVTWGN